jgi:hypothetical protein
MVVLTAGVEWLDGPNSNVTSKENVLFSPYFYFMVFSTIKQVFPVLYRSNWKHLEKLKPFH